MIAGVHSTVWIFARSAELISRAFWKSCSSVQSGYSVARRSQIELCSRANSVRSRPRPSHHPGTWANASSSGGGRISSPPCCTIRNLPPLPVLTLDWRFWSVG